MNEQFDLEDKRTLQECVSRAIRLLSCKFFKNRKPDLTLALGDELAKAIVPEEEELIVMLTILRPFTANDEDIFLNKIVSIIRKHADLTTSSLNRLNSIQDEFKFYNGDYDKSSSKYQRKYSEYIIPFSDIACNFEERSISEIRNIVFNGKYFHSDLEKQREFDNFINQQSKRWQDPLGENDLTNEQSAVIHQSVQEIFKFRFYELMIALASCVFELKKLIQELFEFPLDEEHQQKPQI